MGAAFARVGALAEQIDRPEYLGQAFFGQWFFRRNRGEYKLALALAEQVEKIGQARNDLGLQYMGRYASGFTRLYLGDFVAARALLERCLGLAIADPALRCGDVPDHKDESDRQISPIGLSLAPSVLSSLAQPLAYLGFVDQARSRLNEALSEARRLRYAQTLAEVLTNASIVESIAGSPRMQGHVEELLALSIPSQCDSLSPDVAKARPQASTLAASLVGR